MVGDGGPRAQSTRLGHWLGKRHETVSDGYLVERFTPLKGMTRFKFSKILEKGEPCEPLPTPCAREVREILSCGIPIAPDTKFTNVHPGGQFEPSGGVNVGGGSPQNADEGDVL